MTVAFKTQEHSISFAKRDALQWTREEGLASIASAYFADLSPKHHVPTLPSHNIVSQFVWRMANDVAALQEWISELTGAESSAFAIDGIMTAHIAQASNSTTWSATTSISATSLSPPLRPAKCLGWSPPPARFAAGALLVVR